jgi:hypothetical protein
VTREPPSSLGGCQERVHDVFPIFDTSNGPSGAFGGAFFNEIN